jgi:hypothetical protein
MRTRWSHPLLALFPLPVLTSLLIAVSPYDVDSTGERFLVLAAPTDKPTALNLIVNWPELLKKGVPAR